MLATLSPNKAAVLERLEAKRVGIEIARGEDIKRRCDMNPRGLM